MAMRATFFTRSLLVLAVAALLGAAPARACNCPCDDDSDCRNGKLCNPDSGNCENPTDECATDVDCDDGSYCNGSETCDRFDGCLVGSPVDCGESDDPCTGPVCDEEIQGCSIEPRDDGTVCGDYEGDTCVIAAVCAAGDCLVTPLCNESCERCDPAGCATLCGNPFGNATDVINTTDALYALRASVELEQCPLCVCDVNGDGVVTATDVLLMLRNIVGLGDLLVCTQDTGSTTTTTLIVP